MSGDSLTDPPSSPIWFRDNDPPVPRKKQLSVFIHRTFTCEVGSDHRYSSNYKGVLRKFTYHQDDGTHHLNDGYCEKSGPSSSVVTTGRPPSPTVTQRSLDFYVSDNPASRLRQTTHDPRVLPRHDIDETWTPSHPGSNSREFTTTQHRSVDGYNQNPGSTLLGGDTEPDVLRYHLYISWPPVSKGGKDVTPRRDPRVV